MMPAQLPEANESAVPPLEAWDEQAWEPVVRAHAGPMLAAARRLLPSEESAREAVMEAFLVASRSMPRSGSVRARSTWLHRVLVRCALKRPVNTSDRSELPIEDLLPNFDAEGRHASPILDWPASVERTILKSEVRARVRHLIHGLPFDYRAVLLLGDIENLGEEQIAEILDLSPAMVRTRAHRARQALLTQLTRHFDPHA